MDELKIESRLLRGLVSRVIKHNIKKKFGYDIDINLQEFHITTVDGGAIRAHLNINAELSRNELEKILKDQVL